MEVEAGERYSPQKKLTDLNVSQHSEKEMFLKKLLILIY
mgnify:CR=1 FL=1